MTLPTSRSQQDFNQHYLTASTRADIKEQIKQHLITSSDLGLHFNTEDQQRLNLSNQLIKNLDLAGETRKIARDLINHHPVPEHIIEDIQQGRCEIPFAIANNTTFINTSFYGLGLFDTTAQAARFDHCAFRQAFDLHIRHKHGLQSSEWIAPKFTLGADLGHLPFEDFKSVINPQFYDKNDRQLHGFTLCPDTHNVIYDGALSSALENAKTQAKAKEAYAEYQSTRKAYTRDLEDTFFYAQDLYARAATTIVRTLTPNR